MCAILSIRARHYQGAYQRSTNSHRRTHQWLTRAGPDRFPADKSGSRFLSARTDLRVTSFAYIIIMKGRIYIKSAYISTEEAVAIEQHIAMMRSISASIASLALWLARVSGWRIDDILSIKLEDINDNQYGISIEGISKKTDKPQYMFLTSSDANRLRALLAGLRHYSTSWLFPSLARRATAARGSAHLSRCTVYRYIKLAIRALNINKQVSPHSWRKCYAVNLYRAHKSLELVRVMLGHDNINTTLIYALSDVITTESATQIS
jgi:integrase